MGSTKDKRLYSIYYGIRARCYNTNQPGYIHYGGRGIKMCYEWENNFYAFQSWALNHGYQDGLSIDRIDNDGDYSPNNCRWVNNTQQQNNKRNNRTCTIQGVTKTLSEWSEIYHINLHTIYGRLRNGWDIVKAITQPSKGKRNIMITYNGRTQNIPAWSKELGIPEHALRVRIVDYRWDIDRAMTEPIQIHTKKG